MIAFDEVLLAKADCLNMHGSVLVQSQLKHTIASGSNAGVPSLPETLKSDCDIKTTTLANELRNINAYLTVDTQSSQRQSASPGK